MTKNELIEILNGFPDLQIVVLSQEEEFGGGYVIDVSKDIDDVYRLGDDIIITLY